MRIVLIAILALGAGIGVLMPDDRAAPPPPPSTMDRAGRAAERDIVIERGASGQFHAGVRINGHDLEMLVDTGASAVALAIDDARRLGIPFDAARFDIVGTGASGPVRGQHVTLASVTLGTRRMHDVPAIVVEGLDRSLLGQSYLRHVALDIRGDTMRIH